MVAGWSKLCTTSVRWFLGWLLLSLLSVQCLTIGMHQGRHSAFLLGAERFQSAQVAPHEKNESRAADDGISEGNCALCQLQGFSTGFQIVAPAFAPLSPPRRYVPGNVLNSLPFKIISAFTARAPPLA